MRYIFNRSTDKNLSTLMQNAVAKHRFDADLDSNFYFDADPDPDPISIKRCGFTCEFYPKFYTCWKIGGENIFIYSQQSKFTMFFLSQKWQRCYDMYFGQYTEIFG
jgi:hypothetical protein